MVSKYRLGSSASGALCSVAPGKRYFPVASQSVERAWDLDGSALPTVTTSTAYDCATPPYTNDVANWRLGRLVRSAVTSSAP